MDSEKFLARVSINLEEAAETFAPQDITIEYAGTDSTTYVSGILYPGGMFQKDFEITIGIAGEEASGYVATPAA
jgi:hypothetical protein